MSIDSNAGEEENIKGSCVEYRIERGDFKIESDNRDSEKVGDSDEADVEDESGWAGWPVSFLDWSTGRCMHEHLSDVHVDLWNCGI